MLADFHIVTITHQDLNVDEIGHFVIKHSSKNELQDRLSEIKKSFQIKELIYLSTCNRLTFITYDHLIWNKELLREFFLSINPDLDEEKLMRLPKIVRIYNGEDAVTHLFEVASSIDSMVVGEREIFRQFREAYHFSKKAGLLGDNLRLLEKYTVIAAKNVYANTKIGERALSIVSLAIQKLLESDLPKDARILMVGAGETNLKVAKFLVKYGYTNATVFNRNLNNAEEISNLLNAKAFHLRDLSLYDQGFDMMIVCTGATSSLISMENYRRLVGRDTSEKLIIDLSVPHNVDPEIKNHFPTQIINIEQLRLLAEKNHIYRKTEIVNARTILKKEIKSFVEIYQQRMIERSMKDVPKEIKAIKKRALEVVFNQKLADLDDSSRELVNEMMNYMEKKCISVPMKLAKQSVKNN